MRYTKSLLPIVIVSMGLWIANTGTVMSDQEKPKLEEQVLSTDYRVAKQALEESLRRRNVAAIRLGLKNHSLLIKREAADALRGLMDKASVGHLIEALENNQVVYRGGSETLYFQAELNKALAFALEKLTGIDFHTGRSLSQAEIKLVLDRGKQWWVSYQRRHAK